MSTPSIATTWCFFNHSGSGVFERWLLAIHATGDASAQCEVSAGRAMISAVGLVLLRSASEFGVGEYQRVVPLAEFVQRALQRNDSVRKLPKQTGLRAGLTAVRVESA